MEKDIRCVRSDIGGSRPNLTQPSLKVALRGNLTKSGGEDVLSTTLLKDENSEQTREQRLQLERSGVKVRSSAAAEKSGE